MLGVDYITGIHLIGLASMEPYIFDEGMGE
jgi:hypothetical protein